MDVIDGSRDERVRELRESLLRFICSTDETESQAAMDKAIAIDQRIRPRGALRLVTSDDGAES